jgi:hypothetical protein
VTGRRANRPIGDMVTELLQRLDPVVEKIATIVREMPVQARLQLVRKFDDPAASKTKARHPKWPHEGGRSSTASTIYWAGISTVRPSTSWTEPMRNSTSTSTARRTDLRQ